MDKMSLFSILTVSVPDSILNLYLAFLITGEKIHLYLDDKINIRRLLAAVPLMTIASVATRWVLPNFATIIPVNIILFILIIKFTYSMNWRKSVITIILIYGVVTTVELAYAPISITLINGSLHSICTNDLKRLLFTLPERAIQLFLIISLWNWDRLILNIKSYKEAKVPFIFLFTTLISSELIYLLVFLYNVQVISPILKVICYIGFFLLSLVNFSLFKFIITITNNVGKKELQKIITYKKVSINQMYLIRRMLEDGNIESAKALCDEGISKNYKEDICYEIKNTKVS